MRELYSLILSFGVFSITVQHSSRADKLNFCLPGWFSYFLTSGKRAVCHCSENCCTISVKCQTFAGMSHFRDVAHTLIQQQQLCEQQTVAKAVYVENPALTLTSWLRKNDSSLKKLFILFNSLGLILVFLAILFWLSDLSRRQCSNNKQVRWSDRFYHLCFKIQNTLKLLSNMWGQSIPISALSFLMQ